MYISNNKAETVKEVAKEIERKYLSLLALKAHVENIADRSGYVFGGWVSAKEITENAIIRVYICPSECRQCRDKRESVRGAVKQRGSRGEGEVTGEDEGEVTGEDGDGDSNDDPDDSGNDKDKDDDDTISSTSHSSSPPHSSPTSHSSIPPHSPSSEQKKHNGFSKYGKTPRQIIKAEAVQEKQQSADTVILKALTSKKHVSQIIKKNPAHKHAQHPVNQRESAAAEKDTKEDRKYIVRRPGAKDRGKKIVPPPKKYSKFL